MSDSSIYEHEPQLEPRNPFARPGPIPDVRLEGLLQERMPSLIARSASTSTSSSSSGTTSCGPKDTTGICERPTSGQDTTLPITLGVVIPLAVAFVVMIYLHRRNVKKQRREDAEDRHKSLDFGLGPGQNKRVPGQKGVKGRAKGPEMSMSDANNEIRRDRGLSMDLGLTNPYLLPPGLQQSRESLHSLSRSFNMGDDKYARTDFIPDDGSIRSPSSLRKHADDSSSFTGSSRPRFDYDSSKTLVQSSTKSGPPTRKASLTSTKGAIPDVQIPRKPPAPAKDNLLPPALVDPARDSFVSTASSNRAAATFRKSNDYLSAFIRGGGLGIGASDNDNLKNTQTSVAEVKPEPRKEESQAPPPLAKDGYSHNERSTDPNSHPVPVHDSSTPNARQSELPQLNLTNFSEIKTPSAPEISLTEHNNSYDTAAGAAPRHESQNYPQQGSENYSRENSYYDQQRHGHEHYEQQQLAQPPYDQQYYNQRQYDQQQHDPREYDQHQHGQRQYDQHQHDQRQYDQQHDDQQQYDRPNHDSQQYEQQDYDQHAEPQMHTQHYDEEDDYYDPEDTYSVYDEYDEYLGYDPRRLTMGMRPLPPDDPSENPEQRANRIRSFYKEYFDESNRTPYGGYQQQGYFDGSEYYDDYYYQEDYYPPRGHSAIGGRHRGHTFSNGSYMPGPRAFSSASGRYGYPGYGGPRGRMPPKKKLPPPKALNILPTPSKLKDDTFLLDQAVDFAPPNKAFLQRAGTPVSLQGGQRPYSPGVRAHIPLVSSFDDLSAMPSPHMLRKSGTFTALDFAPPVPKYRGPGDSMSETGSIRSNRSGMSAMRLHNIRAGAYRLSRIPKEVAGTKQELSMSLKPKWDMNR